MELRSFHQICKCHPLFGACGEGSLRIEHANTLDLPDGRPTLPLDDDESLWALVTPLPDGRTLWRRIHLQLNAAKQGEVCNSFDRYHDQNAITIKNVRDGNPTLPGKSRALVRRAHGLWVWRSVALTKELLARVLPPAPRGHHRTR